MARTVLDVNLTDLEIAAEELGTKTKVDTVNTALAEIARRHRQRAFLETLDEHAQDLSGDEVMAGAWR